MLQENENFGIESAGWEGGRLLPGTGNDKVLYYVNDHLGSVRAVKDGAGTIRQRYDYYPYGSVSRSWSSATTDTPDKRYRFSGKEIAGTVSNATSTGADKYLDFGARLYNPRTAIWLSQDPMAEDYYPFTPYLYCAANPVNVVDPDGRWFPNSFGHLIPEQGDTIESLAVYLGCSYDEAFSVLNSQNYINEDGLFSMTPLKDVLFLDNPYTRSIANSTGDLTTEKILTLGNQAGEGADVDKYNCWGSAISGTMGKEITRGVGINYPSQFDAKLVLYYKAISPSNAVFGKTVIRFANDNNTAQHGAVYYGRNNSGDIYVYTKNGWNAKPEIMSLSSLQAKIPWYGTIQGYKSGQSGYYIPR